jgi:Fe-S oxidoreductase
MCPSYVATRQEKDSTRGRARVLQDAVTGRLPGGWRSEALTDALDLCLGCKGCARDCPTGVDMATYKAEWLHQRYAGRRRPLAHYTLGRLPQLLRAVPPRLAHLGLTVAPRLAARLTGVDPRRSLPRPARHPVSSRAGALAAGRPDVVVWVDTFTDRFTPEVADDAVAVLTAAGQRVGLLAYRDECCGLTWASTGQLPQARARLGRLLARLESDVPDGVPVVALEPSCLALLRVDSDQLLTAVPPVAGRLRTLAEHLASLAEDGRYQPPDLTGTRVVAQPHCHHASLLGWTPDEQLLRSTGAAVTRVSGCCGLAGDFGMTPDHYAVSTAVFESELGPAVRSARAAGGAAAEQEPVVLADGFSCRTQLADLAGAPAVHLASLLAAALPGRAVLHAADHAV